ncbi:lysocardiolipin acyltransferase 1 isoform X3 [Molossus molossus]|nr:lysocardiolipin acyltransferase 1 isoform X3 [Molossus molossus]
MVSWKGIYFILTLFWGSFFGSIFMLGPFLPLMFVNPSWYRWINNRLVATWLTLPVALLETIFGVKVIITGDAFVPGERSVIIMNHRTRMDWMFLWNCLMRYSYLRLEKICLKASLKSVPGFGWAMQAAAYIFIHRKWKDDKSHFEDMIGYFCDIREPLQLLIFPEGTDLTENSKARSNDFAEKNGLQKYEYVLHPRTTGFTFVVDRLREAKVCRRGKHTCLQWLSFPAQKVLHLTTRSRSHLFFPLVRWLTRRSCQSTCKACINTTCRWSSDLCND